MQDADNLTHRGRQVTISGSRFSQRVPGGKMAKFGQLLNKCHYVFINEDLPSSSAFHTGDLFGQPGVQGGKARLVHINEQVREFIRNARRAIDASISDDIADPEPSLEALLMTLAKEMTPTEQKQLTSLLLREGISGLLLRLGLRDRN